MLYRFIIIYYNTIVVVYGWAYGMLIRTSQTRCSLMKCESLEYLKTRWSNNYHDNRQEPVHKMV